MFWHTDKHTDRQILTDTHRNRQQPANLHCSRNKCIRS